jgi:hypothetical protein
MAFEQAVRIATFRSRTGHDSVPVHLQHDGTKAHDGITTRSWARGTISTEKSGMPGDRSSPRTWRLGWADKIRDLQSCHQLDAATGPAADIHADLLKAGRRLHCGVTRALDSRNTRQPSRDAPPSITDLPGHRSDKITPSEKDRKSNTTTRHREQPSTS